MATGWGCWRRHAWRHKGCRRAACSLLHAPMCSQPWTQCLRLLRWPVCAQAVLPIVFGALEENAANHWNPAVHGLTCNVRKMFMVSQAGGGGGGGMVSQAGRGGGMVSQAGLGGMSWVRRQGSGSQ